jgi:hypothetical protein
MVILTIYTLFGDDIRQVATGKGADGIFYVVTFLCLIIFTIEIIIASISVDDYLLGFYFWLDAISTITLIADIGWIWDAICGT